MSLADLSFLVVEDHDFQRRTLVAMLERLGARAVHAAADGAAGLAVMRDAARPVDVVISDLDMPGMDGMEFIRHLSSDRPRVSMILTSAAHPAILSSVQTMAAAYGLAVLGVLEKPVTPEKLRTLLEVRRPAEAPRARRSLPAFSAEEIAAGLRGGQFEPFFQPKVDLVDGRLAGCEALARWRHPVHGVVAPGAFIAAMERSQLIDELTWTMLDKSAACCSAWRQAGTMAGVSVNLSLRSLAAGDLAERITAIVRARGLAPSDVVLEVTESATTAEIGPPLENLSRLRLKGFGLSIDDYGTGYSSMQQLTRIAFTELKIDRSFVAQAGEHAAARTIVASSVELASRLGLSAVAEGIETRAEWDLVRSLGCQFGQGFLIAPPMPAEAFMAWARDWPGLP